MFWLLVTYLLMIVRCEYTDGKSAEDIKCTVENNTRTAAASSFKKIIDSADSYLHGRGNSRSIRVDGAYSTIYLAGVTSTRDLATNLSLAGNFDGQVRNIFARINQTLVEQHCSQLHDLVATTAFITNGTYGKRFAELRKEIFNGHDFPTSALITIASLANEEMMVEVQAIAVIPSTNQSQNIHFSRFVISMCLFFIIQAFSS